MEDRIHEISSDEMLVAFLDGELDGEDRRQVEELLKTDSAAAERLAFLAKGLLSVRDAFDPLLDAAPVDRLAAMIPPAPSEQNAAPMFGRRGFLAAAAACLVAGVVGNRIAVLSRPADSSADRNWRAVVANYMMLYAPETLSNLPHTELSQDQEISTVSSAIGLPLSAQAINIPGAAFKRAQLLRLGAKPLAQIAYLDPVAGPMALCVIPSTSGPAEPQSERREGLNLVYWSSDKHAFLVIGHNSADALKDIAARLRRTLPA